MPVPHVATAALPQLEVIGLWLIGVGSFFAMIGIIVQRPKGLNRTPQDIASRLSRIGYSASAGGAFWSAVGGVIVAAENVPSWPTRRRRPQRPNSRFD